MKTERIDIRIEPDIKLTLEKIAQNENRTLSNLINSIFKQYIKGANKMKTIIILSLSIFLLYGCDNTNNQNIKKSLLLNSYNNQQNQTFMDNVALNENHKPLSNELVFVGDSIARNMANYCLNDIPAFIPIKNWGHGGDTIPMMVNGGNWQKAFIDNPQYVVINIGINDICSGLNVSAIENQYYYLVKNAETTSSKIFFLTLVPEEKEGLEGSQPSIKQLNEYIKSFSSENIIIIDVYNLLSKEGHQIPEYFTADNSSEWTTYFGDKLHPNTLGMSVIINEIKKHL
jgi:lysophospholipase L1-like esterase